MGSQSVLSRDVSPVQMRETEKIETKRWRKTREQNADEEKRILVREMVASHVAVVEHTDPEHREVG